MLPGSQATRARGWWLRVPVGDTRGAVGDANETRVALLGLVVRTRGVGNTLGRSNSLCETAGTTAAGPGTHWAIRSAGRTHKRAAPCSRGGARRTRQPSLRPGRPGVPGPTTAPRNPTELVVAHRPFPAHPGAGNAPRAHQPGRAGPAKPRPVTRPPLHLPRQPQKRERQHPREPPTANPDDRPHRPRDPTLRETPTPDQEPAPHPTTHTPTPQTPHTHKQTGQEW